MNNVVAAIRQWRPAVKNLNRKSIRRHRWQSPLDRRIDTVCRVGDGHAERERQRRCRNRRRGRQRECRGCTGWALYFEIPRPVQQVWISIDLTGFVERNPARAEIRRCGCRAAQRQGLGYGRGCGAGPRCEKTRPRVTGRSTRYLYRWEEKDPGLPVTSFMPRFSEDMPESVMVMPFIVIGAAAAGGAIAARVMNAAKMLPVARMFCPCSFPYSLPSRCGIGVSGNVVRADR